jgi:hypothetical protein
MHKPKILLHFNEFAYFLVEIRNKCTIDTILIHTIDVLHPLARRSIHRIHMLDTAST